MAEFSADGRTRAEFLRLCLGAGAFAAGGVPSFATGAERMIARKIPATGEELPVVGVGTWQTFDVGSAREEREPLAEILRLLFEAGGSVIDSSPMYGRAEEVVGDLIAAAGSRSRAFLATKVWIEGRRRGIDQMRASQRLMRSEVIDLMQVHNLVDWRTQLSTIDAWKERGQIRYSGITHYTPGAYGRLASVIEDARPDFVQLAYSITVREAEERLLPLAADKGVAVIINRPYEGGGLFRKVRRRDLPPWAAEIDCESWGQFFLKFILGHPAVTCVIPGTARVKHLLDNVAAGRGRLPDEAMRQRMARFVAEL
jgi:aryl-alcohol dehydrogenase-like predicted oxidoreductase